MIVDFTLSFLLWSCQNLLLPPPLPHWTAWVSENFCGKMKLFNRDYLGLFKSYEEKTYNKGNLGSPQSYNMQFSFIKYFIGVKFSIRTLEQHLGFSFENNPLYSSLKQKLKCFFFNSLWRYQIKIEWKGINGSGWKEMNYLSEERTISRFYYLTL